MATWVIACLYTLVLVFVYNVADSRSRTNVHEEKLYTWKEAFVYAIPPCLTLTILMLVVAGYVLIFSLSN